MLNNIFRLKFIEKFNIAPIITAAFIRGFIFRMSIKVEGKPISNPIISNKKNARVRSFINSPILNPLNFTFLNLSESCLDSPNSFINSYSLLKRIGSLIIGISAR